MSISTAGHSRASHFAFKIAPSRLGIWIPISYVIPWAYPSSHPKRHLGWFSRFWSTVCKKGSPYAIGPLSVDPVCLTVTLVYRGQTSEWIRIPVGTEVGLGPGDIVTWVPSSPTERGTASPLFGPCLMWPNGRPSQQLLSSCCTAHGRQSLYFTLRLTISAFILAW